MLFGFNQKPQGTPSAALDGNGAASGATSPSHSFDVTLETFEEQVIKASMTTPVMVDFWAPWCGPCKQLMPVLESEIAAADGKVLLAKVNIDEQPQLAQMMQVQSVPTVLVFFQGQPVTGFQGAQPPSQIKKLMTQLVEMARQAQPDALDIPTVLTDAAAALADQDLQTAQHLYARILQEDPKQAEAYAGMIRVMVAAGALDQAEALMAQADPDIQKTDAFQGAQKAFLFQSTPSENTEIESLARLVAEQEGNHQARYDLAIALFTSGAKEKAVDHLLTLIAVDREWDDQAARKKLLEFFEAMGPTDPVTVAGRKKLSRLLFS